MQRLRLKADGRIVELRDGQEFPLAPAMPAEALVPSEAAALPAVRDLRRRARLTQTEFASRLGVPVETIRNWEQGKRAPRPDPGLGIDALGLRRDLIPQRRDQRIIENAERANEQHVVHQPGRLEEATRLPKPSRRS